MTALTPEARRREARVGLAVAAGGLVLLIAALLIADPVRQSPGLGPKVLPVVISGGLVLCGILLAVAALRGKDVSAGLGDDLLGEHDAEEIEEILEMDEPPVPWRNLAVVVLSMIAYAFIYIPLGFILSTATFLMAVTTWIHPARWLRNLIFAIAVPVGVYFLFTEVLSVNLPSGILPF